MEYELYLKELKQKDLYRTIHTFAKTFSKLTSPSGEVFYNFSSNDYLNLANDSRLKEATKKAVDDYGIGSTGSRLISGSLNLHNQLEKETSELLGYQSTLLFGSGFMANYGAITALFDSSNIILFDKLCHASLIDGIYASGAKWRSYPHLDYSKLEVLLEKYHKDKKCVIVSESLFSMDGDIADIKRLKELSEKYSAMLFIDEAHSVGVYGDGCNSQNGSGISLEQGVKPDIITGNYAKAFGCFGGFVSTNSLLREVLINTSRSLIYSTSLPVSIVAPAIEAVKIVKNSHKLQKALGTELLELSLYAKDYFKSLGLDVLDNQVNSQIIPVMVYDEKKAIEVGNNLLNDNIYLKGIRYPTTAKGHARMRVTIGLGHNRQDIEFLGDKLKKYIN